MNLIKINTDHFVVVDDSEIREGDYYLFTWGGKQEIQRFFKEQYADRENHRHLYDNACKKITHSTQPLDCTCAINNRKLDSNCAERNHCFNKIQQISLSEVKGLIGEVDVEKKAEEYADFSNDYVPLAFGEKFNTTTKRDYLAGYNQALEDSKEKKYTEEDVIRIVEKSRETGLTAEYLIQSLQPKTEWEVKFVDGKLKLKQ